MRNAHYKPFPNLIALLILSMMACHACALTHKSRGIESDAVNSTSSPKIIFLNYSVKKISPGGKLEIQLTDRFIAAGKLKNSEIHTGITKPGDLRCITLDNHMNPLDNILVPDPLNITVESVDENNALFKREIAKDSAIFSVRMQLTDQVYAVGIKKSTDSVNQNSYLLITKLK